MSKDYHYNKAQMLLKNTHQEAIWSTEGCLIYTSSHPQSTNSHRHTSHQNMCPKDFKVPRREWNLKSCCNSPTSFLETEEIYLCLLACQSTWEGIYFKVVKEKSSMACCSRDGSVVSIPDWVELKGTAGALVSKSDNHAEFLNACC